MTSPNIIPSTPTAAFPEIWILEDDQGCNFIYEQVLKTNFKTRIFTQLSSFAEVLDADSVYANQNQVLIADLYLPDGEFLDLFKVQNYSEKLKNIKYLVVSSLDDLELLQKCFSNGAVDYLTKPFGKSELVYKLNRIIQTQATQKEALRLDEFRRRAILNNIVSDELTTREFQILFVLNQSPNRLATKNEITHKVWDGVSVQEKTFDVHLVHLRQKIRPLGLQIVNKAPFLYQLVINTPIE